MAQNRFRARVTVNKVYYLSPILKDIGDEHDLDLSRLSSIMALFGAVNIFYAMYGIIQRNWVNMLIPTVTYLFLMYSSAIIYRTSRERAREKGMKKSTL